MLSIHCSSHINHEQIGKHSESVTNIKPFKSEYNWEKINFPSEKDDWKNLRKIM